MKDVSLTDLLSDHGFEGKDADTALSLLQKSGFTRPGKKRIAIRKTSDVSEALKAEFIRICQKDACIRGAAGDPRRLVRTNARYCDICGGQDNRRAVDEMLCAMRYGGLEKLLVVGGSPNARRELKRLCDTSCELRFITDEDNPTRNRIVPQMDWADMVLVWASTQISHKATVLLRGPKVVTVPKRGITALAHAVRDSLQAKGAGCRPTSA